MSSPTSHLAQWRSLAFGFERLIFENPFFKSRFYACRINTNFCPREYDNKLALVMQAAQKSWFLTTDFWKTCLPKNYFSKTWFYQMAQINQTRCLRDFRDTILTWRDSAWENKYWCSCEKGGAGFKRTFLLLLNYTNISVGEQCASATPDRWNGYIVGCLIFVLSF